MPEGAGPCERLHGNASPSHAEGAWCGVPGCGQFAALGHFEDSHFAGGLKPYLSDLRGIDSLLSRVEQYRHALITIARIAGPGLEMSRVIACRAMEINPEQSYQWIDG